MPRRGYRKPRQIAGDPSDPRGFHALVREYLESLQVRSYSDETIEQRRSQLNHFIEWAESRSLCHVTEITRPILERYQRHLYYTTGRGGKRLTFNNQHRRLSSVRNWFKWLTRQRLVLHNPASEIELPKLGHRLPKHVLSESEVEEVLACTDVTEPFGLRDRAILETFYSTGIRRMELVNLQLCDVDAERGVLTVRLGKGKKDRVVPIGDRALAWTAKYLAEVRPELVVDDQETSVYLTRFGWPFCGNAMSQLVTHYVNAAATGKAGSCHLFRHTMATLLHEHGADIRDIQAMLGHAKLDTTQIYTQVGIRRLKQVHREAHPARLERKRDTSSDSC